MSRLEITLDLAIELLRQASNFDEYKESLGVVTNKCLNHADIERAKIVIDEVKKRLLENDEEFRTIMDRRKMKAKMEIDENRAVQEAEMAKASLKSDISDKDIDEWVSSTKFKIVDPEELERRMDDKLGCPNPKCDDHGKNRRNVMNNIPTCMRCYHKLVPESKFRDYNRAYWRRFARSRS